MKRVTRITEALLRKWPLPAIDGTLGKEQRGRVLVIGGSREIPGGVLLAAIAALRAGAGTLQIATSKSVATAVATAVPEARVIGLPETRAGEIASVRAVRDELESCDALLVGPGMVEGEGARAALRARKPTLVLDAGMFGQFRKARGPTILTPHAGEMATFCHLSRDEVLDDPVTIAREMAERTGAVIALKGKETIIAAPDGTTFRNTAGNAGLGTSGSGDTLSGVIAGLAARGADALQAAAWGVFVHARAGEILGRRVAPLGFLARELLHEIPRLVATSGR